MSQFQEEFLPQVQEGLETGDPFQIRTWVTKGHYFELLTTEVLEKLHQVTRDQIQAGGCSYELQQLLTETLLRRYLLGGDFKAFVDLTNRCGIEVLSELREIIEKEESDQSPLSRQQQLIETVNNLKLEDPVLQRLQTEIRQRFISRQPFVNVAATTMFTAHSNLVRPAISFIICSDKNSTVKTTGDVFLAETGINPAFRRTAQEIQTALFGKNPDRMRDPDGTLYWYKLELFQRMVRDDEIRLDGQSAGAAIGWLIYHIERKLPFRTALISIWGVYDPHRDPDRFAPVDGLGAKLDACKEDGIRGIVLPQSTLNKWVDRAGTTFETYARQRGMALFPFPDETKMVEVYGELVERWHELPSPYLGLSAFQEKDAEFFFGRETVVDDLLQKVEADRFVALIGASGSGKSSVAFAGLVPRLRESGNWLIAHFRPKDQPLYQLAKGLIPLLDDDKLQDELEQVEKREKSTFAELVSWMAS